MRQIEKILLQMRNTPKNVAYRDLHKVCEHFFGPPRVAKGSHSIFRTGWNGDPRVNIQNNRGMAKSYQVKQVLLAIARLEEENEQT
ncbi:MAG: hypothetical protein KGQ38_05175 [Actinomycetales bacterium]|nr:hypothetical protein [Actinomycetales bacterium]